MVGATDADMALAVNRVRENQGGYAGVKDGAIIGDIALPIAGLMSEQPLEQVVVELAALREAGRTIQSSLQDPTMMLAFLPLCLVPAPAITNQLKQYLRIGVTLNFFHCIS